MQLLTSAPDISPEEREQILQTIEMFEVITQANPQDCQSMEILKDAYQRVGKSAEFLATARKLGDTYAELGQYSAAMLEYEGILKNAPDSPEVVAALSEVEAKLQKGGQLKAPDNHEGAIDLDFRAAVSDNSTLIATQSTVRHGGPAPAVARKRAGGAELNLRDDGNDALAKILIQHRIATEDVVGPALERVHKKNQELEEGAMAMSLIDEIARRGSYETEYLLSGVLDRCKFAFAPLDYYDIDRSIVRMLPDNLTLGRLMLPFDMMSRTVMIAMANPFDALGKEAAQQLLDYNVQWHLASPSAIFRVLKETYRIEK